MYANHHHDRIGCGSEPVGQNIRIATSLEIRQPDMTGMAMIIRRECELTLEVEWRIGLQTAFSRVRVYKFDPDYTSMEDIQCGIKSGRFLYDDRWSVDDPYVRYDPHEHSDIIIEDYADVLKWFGPEFNPANETPPGEKELPPGKTKMLESGRATGTL